MVLPGGQPVIVFIGFATGTSLFGCLASCFAAENAWPMVPLFLNVLACIPLFCCGLMENVAEDIPSYLDDTTDADKKWMDVGWFIFGVLEMSAFLSPMLLARLNAFSMVITWTSTVSTWLCISVIMIVATLMIRGRLRKQGRLED